jgi:formate hydrogenlyase subunit 4
MPDINTNAPNGRGEKQAPGSNWRGTLGISGVLCIFAAVFVGAVSKESGALAPKILAVGGAILIVIWILAAAISAVSSRLSRTKAPSIGPRR